MMAALCELSRGTPSNSVQRGNTKHYRALLCFVHALDSVNKDADVTGRIASARREPMGGMLLS